VLDTRVGYCGGNTDNPTYKQICESETGHAEAVEVVFDPNRVDYQQLVEVFFANHNPTTLNRQGADVGTQYRSVILVHDSAQERIATEQIKNLSQSGNYDEPIVTQIMPASKFWPAENYHQRYYEKKGITPSCNLR